MARKEANPSRRTWLAPEGLDDRLLLSHAPLGALVAVPHAATENVPVESPGRIMTPELRQALESRSARGAPARAPLSVTRPPASAFFPRRTAAGTQASPAGAPSVKP